jgi:hypothetical protein
MPQFAISFVEVFADQPLSGTAPGWPRHWRGSPTGGGAGKSTRLVLPGATFTPVLTVPGAAEIAISMHSASKAWNLAGLKCAAIVTGSSTMKAVTDRLPHSVPKASGPGSR